MKIVQLIPGSGNAFYCENCLRDSSLFRSLGEQGHEVLRLPLYLPIVSDEFNCHSVKSVFFGGINVYLQQKSALFRKTPRWIDRIFDSSRLLKWAASRGGMTEAEELGEMTLSMLQGEEGRQVKELDRLIAWLAEHERPDVIHISNALLLGMVRRIKQELGVPVVCSLQDEDIWVDALPEPQRYAVWDMMAQRAADVDAFISVSKYYKGLMCDRLRLPVDRVHVVYSGIDMEGYREADSPPNPPVIGYLERQCREKGLDILVDAFVLIRNRGRLRDVKLRIAGGKLASDDPFLREVSHRVAEANLDDEVEFIPNLDYEDRLAFLRGLSVMSVPAAHKEAFGIYVIEALASGVPVVEPRHGAFPELLEVTGGGILYEPNHADALADAMETLLLDAEHARELGKQGRKAVFESFSVDRMARDVVNVFESVI